MVVHFNPHGCPLCELANDLRERDQEIKELETSKDHLKAVVAQTKQALAQRDVEFTALQASYNSAQSELTQLRNIHPRHF